MFLFTGSRQRGNLDDRKKIIEILQDAQPSDFVLHGQARGIDTVVDQVVNELNMFGVQLIRMPYLRANGKQGGPIRNGNMICVAVAMRLSGVAVPVVHAFPHPEGTGTQITMRLAEQVQITVVSH